MKDSPSPPPAPDPAQTANAQSNANIATAIANARLNRVNQSTPWGSITYQQGPTDANGVPTWSSQVNLSPEQQAIFNQQQAMSLQRGGLAQQFLGQVNTSPLDFDSLPGVNNRGQMWNGNPHQAPTQQPQQQPMGQQMDMQSIIAAIKAAMGAPSQQGSPMQPPMPQPGSPPGSPSSATPGSPPMQSQPAFNVNYQDYLQNGEFGGSEGGIQPMSEAQWNAMPEAQKWSMLGHGSGALAINSKDPRYADLAPVVGGEAGRDISVSPGAWDPSQAYRNGHQLLVDPTAVYQGDGFHATNTANGTPYAQQNGGLTDLQWALFVASLFGGAAAAGGAFGGGEAALGGAADESAGLSMANPNVGQGAGMAGLDESAGLNLGGQASYAPVTDLSTQAQTPSLWRQALTNVQQGKGLLGMGSPQSRIASSVLPQLLRRRTGGSQ